MNSISRRQWLALTAVLTLGLATKRALGDRRIIILQPLGDGLPDSEVEFAARAIKAFYDVDTRIVDSRELPRRAYYAKRSRYRAEKLLDYLDQIAPADAFRILGLTHVDISTTKGPVADWGILGLASDGRSAVLSVFRCRRAAKNREQARIRFGKVAVHELGHTFGLPHCSTRGCLMEDGDGTVKTLDREGDLCVDCRMRLRNAGHPLAHSSDLPWPIPKKTRSG